MIPPLLPLRHTDIPLSVLHVSCPPGWAQKPGGRFLGVRSAAGVAERSLPRCQSQIICSALSETPDARTPAEPPLSRLCLFSTFLSFVALISFDSQDVVELLGIVYTFRCPRLAGLASITGTALLAQTLLCWGFFYRNARHLFFFFFFCLCSRSSPDFPFCPLAWPQYQFVFLFCYCFAGGVVVTQSSLGSSLGHKQLI